VADERLRTLERAAASGDEAAKAALLVERARLGRVPEGRLAVAALLGEPAARTALGPRAPVASKDVARFVRAVCKQDPQAADRVVLAVAELDLGARAEWPALADWSVVAAAAARAWVERPSAAARQRLVEAAEAYRWRGQAEVMDAGQVVATSLRALGAGDATEDAVRAVKAVARLLGEETVRSALHAALRAWALGEPG
jgi:hypothetical protein